MTAKVIIRLDGCAPDYPAHSENNAGIASWIFA